MEHEQQISYFFHTIYITEMNREMEYVLTHINQKIKTFRLFMGMYLSSMQIPTDECRFQYNEK